MVLLTWRKLCELLKLNDEDPNEQEKDAEMEELNDQNDKYSNEIEEELESYCMLDLTELTETFLTSTIEFINNYSLNNNKNNVSYSI